MRSWSVTDVSGYEIPLCEEGCQGDCGDLEWTWNRTDGFIENDNNGKLATAIYSSDLQINPNPNSGKFEITFDNEIKGTGEFGIFDETGNLIKSIPFTKESFNHIESISLNVANGTYFVRVKINDTIITSKRIIINK